jgi:HK97 gp10 family phage protein
VITVHISGTADTITALRDIESQIEKIAADQAERVSARAYRAVQKVVNQSGGGEPSQPEEAPHKDSGDLRASIFREKSGEYSYRVGTPLDYGKMLEYGTRHMKRRPWLVKTVMKYRKQFYSGMNSRIRQAVKKMGVEGAKVRFK